MLFGQSIGQLFTVKLSRYHAAKTTLPLSRLLSFTPQSRELRVQCYLHTDQFAPAGFYAKAERTLTLSKPFQPA